MFILDEKELQENWSLDDITANYTVREMQNDKVDSMPRRGTDQPTTVLIRVTVITRFSSITAEKVRGPPCAGSLLCRLTGSFQVTPMRGYFNHSHLQCSRARLLTEFINKLRRIDPSVAVESLINITLPVLNKSRRRLNIIFNWERPT